uniref:DZANK-type domain-containing protein n=1 Tax=Panagrellus redivivus TaxID=6233 RepID=A0A7E4USR9_PANRE
MPPEDGIDFQCHVCAADVDMNDKFCRNCGDRFFTPCIFCKSVVDTPDKFCANCGSKRWPYVEHVWYDVFYRTPEYFLRVPVSITVAAGFIYFVFLRSKPAPIPPPEVHKSPLPNPAEWVPEVYKQTASVVNWFAKSMHLY